MIVIGFRFYFIFIVLIQRYNSVIFYKRKSYALGILLDYYIREQVI